MPLPLFVFSLPLKPHAFTLYFWEKFQIPVLAKFCEAILEFHNIDFSKEDQGSDIKETYAEEITAAYSVVANSWIQAKEVKVIL